MSVKEVHVVSGNISVNSPTVPIPQGFVLVDTGFILPGNTSGGVSLPNIGTFSSGLPIAFYNPIPGQGASFSPVYGVSGTPLYLSGNVIPTSINVGSIPALPNLSTFGLNISYNAGIFPFGTLFPFTNTSQIKVCLDPAASGQSQLIYAYWQV